MAYWVVGANDPLCGQPPERSFTAVLPLLTKYRYVLQSPE